MTSHLCLLSVFAKQQQDSDSPIAEWKGSMTISNVERQKCRRRYRALTFRPPNDFGKPIATEMLGVWRILKAFRGSLGPRGAVG